MLTASRQFQSTLPARGATWRAAGTAWSNPYFNPRSPRGERPLGASCCVPWNSFQSTLPARGATRALPDAQTVPLISIHAPREGSDAGTHRHHHRHQISIHAPREGSDLWPRCRQDQQIEFQSTLPARGATLFAIMLLPPYVYFNPRSPRGERPPCWWSSSKML